MPSLTVAEAQQRAATITVRGYRLHLDLDQGEEQFTSRSQIAFDAEPGAHTFLDVRAESVRAVTLNGTPLDVALVADGRLPLTDLAEHNEVVVEAAMAYSRDGHGLHRAVDDADGRSYVYGFTFLEEAPRVFACFDQPDLKAPYDVSVRTPSDWVVFGNGVAQRTGEQDWVLSTTRPLATYFVTVCAGPWCTVRDEHDGIPLSLSARRSQRELLEAQAPQMLQITRQAFDYYHRLYGVRYDFGDYDQVFVPEFNAGAMENPGCVVHSDSLLFRGAISRAQLLSRSNTIAHELAHMWFGDMVTMRWWDDLWLNESFAEYMAHRCLAEATEFTEAFVEFGAGRKVWGYGADRAPSTHPVAGSPAPDAASSLQNFDGISYAKGASVLRQLIAHIGDDVFVEGVRDHVRRHQYANADLADFLESLQRAGAGDLTDWQQAWLRTAGADRLAVELDLEGDVVRGARLRRTTPADHPADRQHTLDVAGFTGGQEALRTQVTTGGEVTPLPAFVGEPRPELLVPNAADLTWAEVLLDDATLAALPQQLTQVQDALARAVVWVSVVNGLARASVDPAQAVDLMEHAWPREPDLTILEVSAQRMPALLRHYLRPAEWPSAQQRLAAAGSSLLDRSTPGSGQALVAARLVAVTTDDLALLQRWLERTGLPSGLEDDRDFRWTVAGNLAARGVLEPEDVDRLASEDRTMNGALSALRTRALRPETDSKERAWGRLTGDESLSSHEALALADGFWDSGEPDVLRSYVDRALREIPPMAERISGMALGRLAQLGYPRTVVEQATLDATERTLAGDGLAPYVRRAFVDQSARIGEALSSRRRFGGVA